MTLGVLGRFPLNYLLKQQRLASQLPEPVTKFNTSASTPSSPGAESPATKKSLCFTDDSSASASKHCPGNFCTWLWDAQTPAHAARSTGI